jgi:hypothetical protein
MLYYPILRNIERYNKTEKECKAMFDKRMSEELVWVQLDLDTVNHNVSSHGLIIPICQQIETWGIDKLLDKHVKIHQKVYDFTPNQKIVQVMASMMFGCEDNKRMNKVLKKDNPQYSQYFGLPRWADQSVISDTFRALTAENITQLETVWKESLEVTQISGNLRRRIEADEYITIDIDLTGDVCKSRDDPTVTKGYFPHKKGKTGRQKAWAYTTDSHGRIQELLALEYGSGKMKLHHCLGSLLEKLITLFGALRFGLEKDKDLRKRIVIRTDAAGGSPRIIGTLDKYGFGYFLKGYSYYVARKVCEAVWEWHGIPDKDGGLFGIGSMSDLPNLGKFCNPIPQLTVFGFRQLKEDGKYENSHYITNVPDYIRLSVDGTLTGMWRYYHKRASIESSIKTERNILHTAHKRGRMFYASWGYLIVAAMTYNQLYLLRDMFFSTTPDDDVDIVGMKDFVRDAINIPCHIETKKVRGKAERQVSLVLDKTNRYAKAFFSKVKEKSIGQLLLPLSIHAQFQQSLFSLRL